MGPQLSPTHVVIKWVEMSSHVLRDRFTIRKDRPYIPLSLDGKTQFMLRVITFFLWIFCICVRSYDAILRGCSPIALETLIPLVRVAFVDRDLLKRREDTTAALPHAGRGICKQQGAINTTSRNSAAQPRRKERIEPQTAFAVEQFVWFILIFFTMDITNINRLSVALFFVNTLHWIRLGTTLKIFSVVLYVLGTYFLYPAYSLRTDFLTLSGQRSFFYNLYSSYSLAFSLTLLMTDTRFLYRVRREFIWRILMLPKFFEKSFYKTPLQNVFSVANWFLSHFFFLGFDFCMALCMWFSFTMFEHALEISITGLLSAVFIIFIIAGGGWAYDFKKVFQESLLCLVVYLFVAISVFFLFPEHALSFIASAVTSAFFVFYIAANSPRRVRSSFPLALIWLGMVAVSAYWHVQRGGINASQLSWYNKLFFLNIISLGGLFMVSTAIHVYKWELRADSCTTAGKMNIGAKTTLGLKNEHKQEDKMSYKSFLTFLIGGSSSIVTKKSSCIAEEKVMLETSFLQSSFFLGQKSAGSRKLLSCLNTAPGNYDNETHEEESIQEFSGSFSEKQGKPLLSATDNSLDLSCSFDIFDAVSEEEEEEKRNETMFESYNNLLFASERAGDSDDIAEEEVEEEECQEEEEECQEEEEECQAEEEECQAEEEECQAEEEKCQAEEEECQAEEEKCQEEKKDGEIKESLFKKSDDVEPTVEENFNTSLTKINKPGALVPEQLIKTLDKEKEKDMVEAISSTTSSSISQDKSVKEISLACSAILHKQSDAEVLSHSLSSVSSSLKKGRTSACNERKSSFTKTGTSAVNRVAEESFFERTSKHKNIDNKLATGKKQLNAKDSFAHVTEKTVYISSAHSSKATFTSAQHDNTAEHIKLPNVQRGAASRFIKQTAININKEPTNKQIGRGDLMTFQTSKVSLHESIVDVIPIDNSEVKCSFTEKETVTSSRLDTINNKSKSDTKKKRSSIASETEPLVQATTAARGKATVSPKSMKTKTTESNVKQHFEEKKLGGIDVTSLFTQQEKHLKEVVPVATSDVSAFLKLNSHIEETKKICVKTTEACHALNENSMTLSRVCSSDVQMCFDDDVPLDFAQFHRESSERSENTSLRTEENILVTESPRAVPLSVRDSLENFAKAWMTRSGASHIADDKHVEVEGTKIPVPSVNLCLQPSSPPGISKNSLPYATSSIHASPDGSSFSAAQGSGPQGVARAYQQGIGIDRLATGAYQQTTAAAQPHIPSSSRAVPYAQAMRSQTPMMVMMTGDGRLAYYPVVTLSYPTTTPVGMPAATAKPMMIQQQPQQQQQVQQPNVTYPQVYYMSQQGYSDPWVYVPSNQHMNTRN